MNCLYQTKRISDLKEKMLSSKRYASIEQARIITRVYQENEKLSLPKKRALSLKAALEELENAFSFMENAFPEGQEMVVFVTELTMGGDSMAFLQDNPCEIYQKYNQQFMVGSKRAELLAELEEGKIRSEEHIRDF